MKQTAERIDQPRSMDPKEVKEFNVENFLIKKKEAENCIVIKDNNSNKGIKIIIEDKANLSEVFAYYNSNN